MRVPLGSSNTSALSCGQNSPSWLPSGVTFNARDGEVIAPDAIWNGLFTFLKPELFAGRGPGGRRGPQ